jgi:hypothetical protein
VIGLQEGFICNCMKVAKQTRVNKNHYACGVDINFCQRSPMELKLLMKLGLWQ